jgi:hypothetical protein
MGLTLYLRGLLRDAALLPCNPAPPLAWALPHINFLVAACEIPRRCAGSDPHPLILAKPCDSVDYSIGVESGITASDPPIAGGRCTLATCAACLSAVGLRAVSDTVPILVLPQSERDGPAAELGVGKTEVIDIAPDSLGVPGNCTQLKSARGKPA